jgi:futalosine hydrolase
MKPKNLLVAATSAEIVEICGQIQPYQITEINENWSVLVTGVGIVPTVFHLTKALCTNNFRFVLNVGLAGAINKSLSLGETVNIISDEFAFWGSEDNDDFLSVFKTGLQNSNEYPFSNGKILALKSDFDFSSIKKVSGITVQTVTGSVKSIDLLHQLYQADVETMEGAAVFYVASQFNIPSAQIRAISNYVEPRNRDNWKIQEALTALSVVVKLMLELQE